MGEPSIIMRASRASPLNTISTAADRKTRGRITSFTAQHTAVGRSFARAFFPSKEAPITISDRGEAIEERLERVLLIIGGIKL